MQVKRMRGISYLYRKYHLSRIVKTLTSFKTYEESSDHLSFIKKKT